MGQDLRTEYITTVDEPAVARREGLCVTERGWYQAKMPKAFKADKIELLLAAWRRNHPRKYAVNCGDSWPPMFVRCFSLV